MTVRTRLSDPLARSRPELVVPALGRWMASVHALPLDGLQPVLTADLVQLALGRLEEGRVDLDQLDRAYRRARPETLRAQLLGSVPPEAEQRVAAHPAARFDSLAFVDGAVESDLIPTESGDRYRNLGPLVRDLARLIGPEAMDPFFEAYGVTHPDSRRLDFFMLLDALL